MKYIIVVSVRVVKYYITLYFVFRGREGEKKMAKKVKKDEQIPYSSPKKIYNSLL
jgi:hypothetical protein